MCHIFLLFLGSSQLRCDFSCLGELQMICILSASSVSGIFTVPRKYLITQVNFLESSVLGALPRVHRKATAVWIFGRARLHKNNSLATLWWSIAHCSSFKLIGSVSLTSKRWFAAAVTASPSISVGSLFNIRSIKSFINTMTFPGVVKSRIMPRYSRTFPCVFVSGTSMPNAASNCLITLVTTFGLPWDIFRSSTCHNIVHWAPSIVLFITHQSYGFTSNPQFCCKFLPK